jgi:hypothetical protein
VASAVQAPNQGDTGSGRGRAETAAALRLSVTRLASASSGSVLLFARDGEAGEFRLRTAAGVASPEAARTTATAAWATSPGRCRTSSRLSKRPAIS